MKNKEVPKCLDCNRRLVFMTTDDNGDFYLCPRCSFVTIIPDTNI